jgi:GTP-binding protein
MPTVAIVGRPNVGKSALFNRLAGRRIAIVHDQAGVTRDRISAPSKATATPCTLIDTGGIGGGIEDGFEDLVAVEADIAMAAADLILFVVDARDGVTPADRELSRLLRKAKAAVLLVVNKVDDAKHEASTAEFAEFGFGKTIPVSAEHGRNFERLCETIDSVIAPLAAENEQAAAPAATGLRLAVVGRPNAGKSSLINSILGDKRTIVSEKAGTTRDAVDLPCTIDGTPYTFIDTAGLRPRSKRDSSVEVFSAMRTVKAVRRADICLLVIDLAAGITAQDRTIARTILEERKPCLIVLNKFDLFRPDAKPKDRGKAAEEHVRRELFFLGYAPFLTCSARDGDRVHGIFREVARIREGAQGTPGTGQLNRILQEALEANPPPLDTKLRRRLKLYYATAAAGEKPSAVPVPVIVLFVNDKRLMSATYETYLANKFRQAHPAPGVPVVFSVRSRTRREWTPPPQQP